MANVNVDSWEHVNRLTDPPLAEAAELEDLLSRLARRMFAMDPSHPSTRMSVNQLRVGTILQLGPRSISDLGRELGLTISNVSQIVERMVKVRLVDRYETRDDHRLRLVKLTDRGAQIMESRKQYRVLRAANALIKLGDGPREEILTALQRLIEAATAASPLRAVPGAAPDWVDRVVREADLKIASSVIEELEQYYEHSN